MATVTSTSLRMNITKSSTTSETFPQTRLFRLYPELYEWVVRHGGSISAEHGIGQMKLAYANFGKSTAERDLVRGLKQFFDPNGILNPYKFL